MPNDSAPRPWYRLLYLQVLLAVVLGVVVGTLFPDFGKSLRPLGDGFIKLVKMMIAPIIFCTVVHGIASMGDLKKLGRVGAKSLLYFEVVSTLALVIGLVVVNVLQPGAGLTPVGQPFHAAPVPLDPGHVAEQAHALSATAFALNIIPSTFLGAFVSGDLLQVLLIAALFFDHEHRGQGRADRGLRCDGLHRW
jgi:aerobic C4-dicarboxylate transport protein